MSTENAEKIGLVHSCYGDGKGKTTAAFGLALRCMGHGNKVVIAQFFKSRPSGEVSCIEQLSNVTLLRCHSLNKFTFQMNDEEKNQLKKDCAELFDKAVRQSLAEDVRLLVLDECLDACANEYLSVSMVTDFLDNRPNGLEVLFTGHSLPPEIEARSDYISRIVKEKHPYDKGVISRKSIEF